MEHPRCTGDRIVSQQRQLPVRHVQQWGNAKRRHVDSNNGVPNGVSDDLRQLPEGCRLLRRGAVQTFVDTEGDIVWTQEYLRYRVGSSLHLDAISKVFAQIEGRGVQPDCQPPPTTTTTTTTIPGNTTTTTTTIPGSVCGGPRPGNCDFRIDRDTFSIPSGVNTFDITVSGEESRPACTWNVRRYLLDHGAAADRHGLRDRTPDAVQGGCQYHGAEIRPVHVQRIGIERGGQLPMEHSRRPVHSARPRAA